MSRVEELAALMPAGAFSLEAQRRQIAYRSLLAERWGIPAGARVLELGCGQGDTTVVLADAVGPGGFVTAVDPAEPSYGAPVSLGESASAIAASPLGTRIGFRFLCDPLKEDLGQDGLDIVVLSHSSWYFNSIDQISLTLSRARAWAPVLCFAEWDLEPLALRQTGHLLAALMQGRVKSGAANVRTPFSRETLGRILEMEGWRVARQGTIEAPDLDDGRWEMEACLRDPERFGSGSLMASELDVLRSLYDKGRVQSLPSYWVVAERS